jgi:signal transduction histidine kinase
MTDEGPGERPGESRLRLGIGPRIALAAFVTALLAVAIVALGVVVVGGDVFTKLMMEHGEDAATAHAMFDEAISTVLALAVVGAVVAAVVMALVLGRWIASPLRAIGVAARRLAGGDYATRVPRRGPDEVVGLADSFNLMASSLEEQERMRREFIANAAHELRTPLTNLKGYLEGLRDDVVPKDRATFVSLLEETDRLARLAAGLDTLAAGDARQQPPRLMSLDVVGVIRTAAELAQPAFERAGVSLALELPDRLEARADPDDLAQVLSNLLQNAVRYTPAGGHVVIRADRRPDEIQVTVSNTGEGIPAADLPHVFERFYRVDKARGREDGGAGIGLAIVQQLVEAADGRVGVESTAGTTRFWFRLPA